MPARVPQYAKEYTLSDDIPALSSPAPKRNRDISDSLLQDDQLVPLHSAPELAGDWRTLPSKSWQSLYARFGVPWDGCSYNESFTSEDLDEADEISGDRRTCSRSA